MRNRDPLRDSQRELRLLSDATDAGIAIAEKGAIIDSNVSLARMMRCEMSELVGKSLQSICTPETFIALERRLEEGRDEPYQGVGVRSDGSTFPAQIKAVEYDLDEKKLSLFRRGKIIQVRCIVLLEFIARWVLQQRVEFLMEELRDHHLPFGTLLDLLQCKAQVL